MKKRIIVISCILLGLLVITAMYPSMILAGCSWEWVCDAQGNCVHKPICDSTTDVVPPETPSTEPVVSPDVKPVEKPTVPPVGTNTCEQVRVCDDYGNCHWEKVCH